MANKETPEQHIALVVKDLELIEECTGEPETDLLASAEQHFKNFLAVEANPAPKVSGLQRFITDALQTSRDIDTLEDSYENSKDETLRGALHRQLSTLHDRRIDEVGYAVDRAKEIKSAYEVSQERE